MDETPPTIPPGGSAPNVPTMSLAARLLNVFAIPGDVFEEVKAAASRISNWLVPALITCLVSSTAVVILFSQPAIQQKIREHQEQSIEGKVKSGDMTRQQADQAMAVIEKFSGPTMMKIFGVVGSVFFGFGRVFWWATVLWVLGMWFLRVRFPYGKALEVAGLAGMIGVLGTVVTLLLQINLSNPASSPSLALLVSNYDQTKISHLLLGAVNVFDLWQAGVLACALSRLAGVPFLRGAFVMFAFWILFHFVQILFGVAFARLAG